MSTPSIDYDSLAKKVGGIDFDALAAKHGGGTAPGAISKTAPPPTFSQKAKGVIGDLGEGILKGAGSTANNLGHLILPDWAISASNKHLGTHIPQPTAEEQDANFKPKNTAQSIGKGIEQAGEFVLPGAAEESAATKLASLAPKLGKAALPLAKIGTSAVGAGLVNKAQGGGFGEGAAMGGIGAAGGQTLKAAAPVVAESALGIPKAMRAFGKTPGEAIINETRGVRPATIAASAQDRIGQLTPDLEAAASRSTTPASLVPARTVLSDAANKAQTQNAAGLHGQLTGMNDTLSKRFTSGQPIPQDVSPSELLDLKRGFSAEHLRWNPEIHDRALSAGRNAYGALDAELDRTVPEAAGLNQRISSLIPVAQRAESVSRNAPVAQKALGRFAAHTGALTLGGLGATQGYHAGGPAGAVVGGVTGIVAPELIASPEGQMVLARSMNKAGALRPFVGAAAQADRKDEKK